MGRYLVNWGRTGKTEITEELLSLIANAQNSIKIGNFIFEYQDVIEGLKTAIERGVAVFILSNSLDQEKKNIGSHRNDEYKSHLNNLIQLASLGAHIHYLDDLHAKFIICDDMIGIVTSANNNKTSLDQNSETGVTIQGQDSVQLAKVFNKLFLNADITRISDYQLYRVKSRQRTKEFDIDTEALLASNIRLTINSNGDTNLKYKKIHSLYDEIVNIINRSKEVCFIVTWHFNCTDNKLRKLITSLNKAKERGVKIVFYSNIYDTTPSQHFNNQPSLRVLSHISNEIYGDNNNHSKCVLSESEGIVFSANIDPIGLDTGFEIGVILSKVEHKVALAHVHNLISANPNKVIF